MFTVGIPSGSPLLLIDAAVRLSPLSQYRLSLWEEYIIVSFLSVLSSVFCLAQIILSERQCITCGLCGESTRASSFGHSVVMLYFQEALVVAQSGKLNIPLLPCSYLTFISPQELESVGPHQLFCINYFSYATYPSVDSLLCVCTHPPPHLSGPMRCT